MNNSWHLDPLFTAGGPISHSIGQVYRHLRLNLESDPDIQETISEVMTKPSNSAAPLHRELNERGISVKQVLKERYQNLRTSYNRNFFISCNPLQFNAVEIGMAETDFLEAKKEWNIESEVTLLENVVSTVQQTLDQKRYSSLVQSNYVMANCRKPFQHPTFRFWLSFTTFLILFSLSIGLFAVSIWDTNCVSNFSLL
jgi:hypothetical protein